MLYTRIFICFLFSLAFNELKGQNLKIPSFKSPSRINTPYGICSHISRKGIDWEVRDKDLNLIKEADINYVRTDFDWNRIQIASETSFDFSALDTMMKSVENENKQILPILGYDTKETFPSWQHLTEWNAYVSAVVKRYNTIPVWEVWNEMNLKYFWRDGPSAEHYATLLEATYKTIKSIDPHKTVLLGGLAGMDKNYLTNLCMARGQNYFDIMNFHYYSGQSVPETIIKNCFKPLQEVMQQYHWNKPVWITETGYPTAVRNDNISKFYTEVLPQVYSKINLNSSASTVAFIIDKAKGFDSTNSIDVDGNFKMFAHRIGITLDKLKGLDPKKIPLLVPTSDESFPMTYFNYLEEYVRKGGTILLPYGALFYFDRNIKDEKLSIVWNTFNNKLHINCLYWWDKKAIELNAPKLADWQETAEGFVTDYSWDYKDPKGIRYATSDNLKQGDQLIPVILSGNKKYTGAVVALYKLNSNLKGNIIVQTRQVSNANISEETQAKRLPRTYLVALAYGVEKVFWYNLRAGEYSITNSEAHFGILHKDLRPKPSYYTYKTLTTMCPKQSTRPVLWVKNDIYIAQWKRNDGKKVAAVWTENIERRMDIRIKGNFKAIDYMGNSLNIDTNNFYATPGVTYFIGLKSISFK